MTNETIWIGERRMEIFKLWLASKIAILSYRANSNDMHWVNLTKSVLNSLGDSYLNDNSFTEVQYGLFVNELLEAATK